MTLAGRVSDERLKGVVDTLDSPSLHTFTGAMDTLAGTRAVRDRIVDRLGPIDGVVASLGGWWERPPLTELDTAVWHRVLADNLTSHFLAARAFLPALVGRPAAVYVMLGGVGATIPIPHAAPVSVTGAAQTRLLECLAAENTGVRLHEVRILTPIVTRHWDRTDRQPEWLTGDQLATVVDPHVPDPDRLILPIPEPAGP